jgi:hypothetical protein
MIPVNYLCYCLTLWYFFFSFYFSFLSIGTTDGTCTICNLFVKNTRRRGSQVVQFSILIKDRLPMLR